MEGVNIEAFMNFLNQITAFQANLNKKNAKPHQDSTSIYYLHPSESIGTPLSTVILDGKNYGDWSRAILWGLKGKNKVRFVDGSLPRLDKDDENFEAWDRCNTYVVAWINHSLSPDISRSVVWNTVASSLWTELKRIYCQGDRFRVAELQEELFAIRQGDLDVTSYFTKLKTIWEDLESFRYIPDCECSEKCSCGLGIIRRYRIEDQVTQFLRGLNEQFSNVRSQIMLLDPLPDVNTILSMLTQQERQFMNMDINPEVKIAYAATPSNTANPGNDRGKGRGRGGRSQGGRGKVQCSHCGRLGHSIDVCYKKHGYPPNLKGRNAAEGAGNFAASLVT
ncbi:uncharacterized protein LOC130939784 [Arachis stenosperma]|uniref:uncharacterized protein LOC130939784 n=1 Tax=Arachis stenosperma TaxID=217475 RepID=UPI0025ABB16F|nr:uncharacterized protein LOC130939784 [Arachis stenosperma]